MQSSAQICEKRLKKYNWNYFYNWGYDDSVFWPKQYICLLSIQWLQAEKELIKFTVAGNHEKEKTE